MRRIRATGRGWINETLKIVQKQLPGYVMQKRSAENLLKFTGKHLYWSIFFNKVADCKTAISFKKSSPA